MAVTVADTDTDTVGPPAAGFGEPPAADFVAVRRIAAAVTVTESGKRGPPTLTVTATESGPTGPPTLTGTATESRSSSKVGKG